MKKINEMLMCNAVTEAREYVKSNSIQKNFNLEMKLLQGIRNASLTSDWALILRLIHRNNGCLNDLSDLIDVIENKTINEKNWKKINILIEDAKLNIKNLVLLVLTIHEEKENEETVDIFYKIDKIYDFNRIEWPSEIYGICQQMVAEIAIFYATR